MTEYEAKTSFRFVTVKGAGHMVRVGVVSAAPHVAQA